MNYPDEIEFSDGERIQKLVRNKEVAAVLSGGSGALGTFKIERGHSVRSADAESFPVYNLGDSQLSGVATGNIKIWSEEPLSDEALGGLEADFPEITFDRHKRIKTLVKGCPKAGQQSASLASIAKIERRNEVTRVSPEIIFSAAKK